MAWPPPPARPWSLQPPSPWSHGPQHGGHTAAFTPGGVTWAPELGGAGKWVPSGVRKTGFVSFSSVILREEQGLLGEGLCPEVSGDTGERARGLEHEQPAPLPPGGRRRAASVTRSSVPGLWPHEVGVARPSPQRPRPPPQHTSAPHLGRPASRCAFELRRGARNTPSTRAIGCLLK